MKFYLASSFDYVNQVKGLASWLEAKGHTMTCRWWFEDYKKSLGDVSDDVWYGQPIVKTVCTRSLRAVEAADIVILVAPRRHSFNGANIEVGYALGRGKPVICFDTSERSAMYEPLIRCGSMDELANVLLEFEGR